MLKTHFILASLVLAFTTQVSANVTRLNGGGDAKGSLPFSEAVKVDNTLYLSGQLGLVPQTGKMISGGITPETRQTMDNIKQVLTANGYQLSDVVKCTVFLGDMKDFSAFNDVYKGYFKPDHLPARSAVAVSGLALNAKVEVECFAAK